MLKSADDKCNLYTVHCYEFSLTAPSDKLLLSVFCFCFFKNDNIRDNFNTFCDNCGICHE